LNLAVDIGNTRIKAGVFDGKMLVESKIFDMPGEDRLAEFARENEIQNAIICSVNEEEFDIGVNLPKVPGKVIRLTERTKIPIVNGYDTPHTLGKDRLAAAIGAYHLFPNANVLIVDAGTCITYDLVTAQGVFEGGNIAPGLDMRLTAMHDYTARLPLVKRGSKGSFMAKSTDGALKNGTTQGILLEIEGYIRRLASEYESLETVLTGGDASYFADLMKTKIFVRSNLVLIGLNEILNVNVAEHN
jgi:type III pantothenate kinase